MSKTKITTETKTPPVTRKSKSLPPALVIGGGIVLAPVVLIMLAAIVFDHRSQQSATLPPTVPTKAQNPIKSAFQPSPERHAAPAKPNPAVNRSVMITAEQYGEDWPFTVSEGTLRCEHTSSIVFITEGRKYAVNGTAMGTGGLDLDPIWAADPKGISPKISIGNIIQTGLALCSTN
jgi:hypothetical protein